MTDAKLTGRIISEKRKEKGLTQIQLAEILNISNRTVSKWENGDGFPDITILPEISKVLDISIDELLTGEKNEHAYDSACDKINDDYNKKARSKFLISEIIAFCLCAGANIIGCATEIALHRVMPFYAFIEIYLLVATVAILSISMIIFLVGYVKYISSTNKPHESVFTELYAFIVLSSVAPAVTAFRMLTWFTGFGYLLRFIFLAVYIIALSLFTIVAIKKRRVKNEQ